MLLSMQGNYQMAADSPSLNPANLSPANLSIDNLSLRDLPNPVLHILLERLASGNFVPDNKVTPRCENNTVGWCASKDCGLVRLDNDKAEMQYQSAKEFTEVEIQGLKSEGYSDYDSSCPTSPAKSIAVDDYLKGDIVLKSVGSKDHYLKSCTPCAFFCYSKIGCNRGQECQFCHENHPKKSGSKGQRRGKGRRITTKDEPERDEFDETMR
jgi:hypothetical protein